MLSFVLPASATEAPVADDGQVLVIGPTGFNDCPLDWVCLWEGGQFTGNIVLFHDCCGWYNLADWGLNNQASSWRNRKGVDAKVADFQDGNGDRLCLNNNSSSGTMPAGWNDRATSLKIFSSSGAC